MVDIETGVTLKNDRYTFPPLCSLGTPTERALMNSFGKGLNQSLCLPFAKDICFVQKLCDSSAKSYGLCSSAACLPLLLLGTSPHRQAFECVQIIKVFETTLFVTFVQLLFTKQIARVLDDGTCAVL